MLRLFVVLGLLSSCEDDCEKRGGYWEHFNCHPYTYWVTNCVVHSSHGACLQSMSVPVTEQMCDRRCVAPPPKTDKE